MILETAHLHATESDFRKAVDEEIARMAVIPMLAKVSARTITIADYHHILCTLFHQVYSSSATFSLAAAHCPSRYGGVREYLMHHADEEKTHWRWILNDLQNTGYAGPSPTSMLPGPATLSYIAFNSFIATHQPVARLAIATVLESFGATLSKRHASLLVEVLGLRPRQLTFFLGHGDTDVGHTKELLEVLTAADLTPADWGWMVRTAATAGWLYREMWGAGSPP